MLTPGSARARSTRPRGCSWQSASLEPARSPRLQPESHPRSKIAPELPRVASVLARARHAQRHLFVLQQAPRALHVGLRRRRRRRVARATPRAPPRALDAAVAGRLGTELTARSRRTATTGSIQPGNPGRSRSSGRWPSSSPGRMSSCRGAGPAAARGAGIEELAALQRVRPDAARAAGRVQRRRRAELGEIDRVSQLARHQLVPVVRDDRAVDEHVRSTVLQEARVGRGRRVAQPRGERAR